MFSTFRHLILIGGFFFTLMSSAFAEEVYDMSAPHLLKMLVRFKAIDIADDDILDEYLLVQECELAVNFKKNDFKWHKIQQAARESIQQNSETYPSVFAFKATLQLDKYNFEKKRFDLTKKTQARGNNSFTVTADTKQACNGRVRLLPQEFRFILSQPLFVLGIPIDEAAGQKLLQQMEEDKNKDRFIYARFNMQVYHISPMVRSKSRSDDDDHLLRLNSSDPAVHVSARLASLEFYEDPKHTKLIYSHKP